MYSDRKKFYEKIERERNSKVIAYVTGDRPGMGAQIGADPLYFSFRISYVFHTLIIA